MTRLEAHVEPLSQFGIGGSAGPWLLSSNSNGSPRLSAVRYSSGLSLTSFIARKIGLTSPEI